MTPVLLHRPAPIPGESFEGYLLRVSDANGYGSRQWVTELAQLTGRSSIGFGDTKLLAGLLEVSQERLDALRYVAGPWSGTQRILRFNGRPVPRMAINLDKPRFCPICLSQSPHMRMAWDLAPVTLCPEHDTLLRDSCDECGAALSWNRGKLCQCHHCGADLRQAKSLTFPAEARMVTLFLLYRAGLAAKPQDLAVPADFARLGLRDAIRVLMLLGSAVQGLPSYVGLRPCTWLNASAMAELIAGVARMLADWPGSLKSLFERPVPQSRHDLGVFARSATTGFLGPQFRFLREAVGSAAVECGFLEDFGMGLYSRRRRNKAAVLAPDDELTVMEACARLNLSPPALDSLVRWGLLEPRLSRNAGQRFGFSAKEVANLLARLGANMAPVPQTKGMITLSKALSLCDDRGIDRGRLFLALIGGRLAVCGRLAGEKGLSACLLERSEVLQWCRRQRPVPFMAASPWGLPEPISTSMASPLPYSACR